MLRVILLFTLSFIFFACSSDDRKADTAEGAYAIAQEFDHEERYEEAIKRYQEVKNKYPYSRFAVLSEMAIADAQYKQESFAEAQVSYQSFKDLHPKHAQIDYVTFRLGMSFFNQLPPTIDRDLTLADSAILYFDEVINQYPNSTHVPEAKEKKASALKMLAEKEHYIADFYFKRDKYDSALNRFEGLLKKYPNLGFDPSALSKAAICAARLGDLDRKNKLMAELQKKFPDSQELNEAQKEAR